MCDIRLHSKILTIQGLKINFYQNFMFELLTLSIIDNEQICSFSCVLDVQLVCICSLVLLNK